MVNKDELIRFILSCLAYKESAFLNETCTRIADEQLAELQKSYTEEYPEAFEAAVGIREQQKQSADMNNISGCTYAVPAGKYSIYIAFCELRTYNLKCNV